MKVLVVLPEEFRVPFETLLRPRYEKEVDLETVYFKELLTRQECVRRFAGKDAVVLTLEDVDDALMSSLPHLKMISIFGVGYDNVDLEAARRAGVEVTNAPGANAASVAEMALALMLSACRQVALIDQQTRSHKWTLRSGIELAGKTCGIIGLGRIGKELVSMLSGFEMRIIAYEKNQDADFARQHNVEFVDLKGLAEQSDVISIHVPLLAETRNLIGEQVFSWMKRSPVIVNTSRGAVVDEPALVQALRAGQVRAAALDVLAQEPPASDHPLREFRQVIITSHIGGSTQDAIEQIGDMVLQDLCNVRDGRKPLHSVLDQKGA